jgi:lycopene beta-cyclase
MTQSYDVAIAGAGLAGLLTAEMITRRKPGASILLLDSFTGIRNDRTWCYWTNKPSPFPDLVSHRWNSIEVALGKSRLSTLPGEIRYEHITEADFRAFILKKLHATGSVTSITTKVHSIHEHAVGSEVVTGIGVFGAKKTFQSIFKPSEARAPRYPVLQHFLGWEITAEKPVFNAQTVTLMDFNVSQKHGFAFMYILPFSNTHALVEYTLFSRSVLENHHYEQAIEAWLSAELSLNKGDYTLQRVEKGVIPMHDIAISTHPASTVVNIGTPAGWVKPSTGYAFKRTIEQVALLEASLFDQNEPEQRSGHFFHLDRLMLHVLDKYPEKGPAIFFNLFKKRGFSEMFRFLDETSSLTDILKIMLSVPSIPFVKAIAHQLR